MMILLESLIATGLLSLAISRRLFSNYRYIVIGMIGIYIFSLIPSFSVPYVNDDVDLFHGVAVAISTHRVLGWLLTPHNEHVIPLVKLIYLFCYKYFWLYPQLFHVIVTGVCLGIMALVYRLILALTGMFLPALIGAAIMAVTNITDGAIFIITDSTIFFCLLVLLLLFFGVLRYAETQKPFWRYVAFLCILAAPSTFALGLTSIIFVFLFYRLCLSKELGERGKDLFPLLFIGWLLSLLPYAYSLKAILYSPHYQKIGAGSVFGIVRLLFPARFLVNYLVMKLVPNIISNLYFSFGLFFLCLFTVAGYFKEINWKRILFFVSFGLVNNFIIYVFRSKWGIAGLNASRYDAFPVIMMAFCYALILDVLLRKIHQINHVSAHTLVYLLCFFAVVYGGLYRLKSANEISQKAKIVQDFYAGYNNLITDYFHESKAKRVQLRNTLFVVPFTRYDRNAQFYAEYVLPLSVSQRIDWSDKTSPEFLDYFESKGHVFFNGQFIIK